MMTIITNNNNIYVHIFRFMDESPRWLINNRRSKEAIEVFKRAARWHKVDLTIPAQLIIEKEQETQVWFLVALRP